MTETIAPPPPVVGAPQQSTVDPAAAISTRVARRRAPELLRHPLGLISLVIIAVFVACAVFAPVLAPSDPNTMRATMRLSPPGEQSADGVTYWVGGDQLGRDLLSRLIYGARTSLVVAICAVALTVLFGAAIGLASAFYGRKFDLFVQRWMDGQQAIPTLVLAMVITAVLGPSTLNIILAIAFVGVPRSNRIVRGVAMSVLTQPYVESARVVGAKDLRILVRHVLPNVAAPIIVVATTSLGSAVLVEASLSFLGLGVPPPAASWGQMISGAGRQFMLQDPRLLLAPAAALSLVILAFNLAGDTLRDIWDPRLRRA